MSKKALTPMMQQYLGVRENLPPNTLLLFRLGDFYEMFDEDAKVGAEILGITLTARHKQPMAGIPYHAADNYIGKILAAGMKVAICDQIETPQPGKIVKRALTRILTPGTILEDHQIEARKNHYLLSFYLSGDSIHAACLDLTTGDFQITTDQNPENLLPLFTSIEPREIIIPESCRELFSERDRLLSWLEPLINFCEGTPLNELPDYHFEQAAGAKTVMETLGVLNLEGFGLYRDHPALGAAGALIYYATENLCAKPANLNLIREYRSNGSLLLDPSTLRNLEVFRTTNNTRDGSLIAVMDATVTAAGSRLLELYLAEPILDLSEIKKRQHCVGEFLETPSLGSELHDYLKCVRDVTRILGRLQNRLRNPRELGGIRDTLQQLPLIIRVLQEFDGPHITELSKKVEDFPELRDLLSKSLVETLPNQLQEGNYICDQYDEELDHLRLLSRDNKTWISELESSEKKRSGIKNLRIKYNNAFGYFIEITKSNIHLVPDDYIRKQTMTNAERYYTTDLKEKEKEILHAEEKSIAREEILFRELVSQVLANVDRLKSTAEALARTDLFLGWSKIAREWDYNCPDIDDGDTLLIEEGRHPVVEQMMKNDRYGLAGTRSFVPNDTHLSSSSEQIGLITGPNMAGKSTYIRQVALLVLMAQIGSWVPAKRCQFGLVDRIFSRVGANDELSQGNSTFMVEMNETANILNNATDKSLIILDEIGRGTSTYDGLSIAWSVVEHLHGNESRGPRTLFATHYHELTQLEQQLARVNNYCVAVKEWNDEIVFMRQVIRGASDRSYGIQVARLAGLPQSVIGRAKTILQKLESDDSSHNLIRRHMIKRKQSKDTNEEYSQQDLF